MRVLIARCAILVGLVGLLAPLGLSAPATAVTALDRVSGPAPGGARVLDLLDRARVVADIEHHPGYDRDCDPGGCVFGEPWTDDHDGPKGHNGCTTREDVLLLQMTDIEMRWGSRCRIYEARLRDPYTGERMTWRDDGYVISIDHVYPLARAWHGGAWAWTPRRRTAFANDVRRELLAVSASANQAKEADGPADWLPAWRRYRCTYATLYVRVAVAWDLPLTTADADAVRLVARSC
ncbi:hypothetical protein ASC64_20020 [Nocardioides sp. Root122]|uniref:HNH endonuclease family protein n=1 Tax=Nocardioides TaxID=1839 RepID=UPI0007030B61|nr:MULTISPECIES: HNH endonuclease family protein [Nocardioides]KQV72639.1 hypothetical protein ASC64_20020 [Nocardioides sp. Root122]MCK9825404.1 HNH endonuclease family protein [Nocardioides cavernae]